MVMHDVLGSRSAPRPNTRAAGASAVSRASRRSRRAAGALPPVRVRHGQLAGTPEADDARQVLGARSPAPLLATAAQQGLGLEPLADDEGADALGSAELVRRKRQEIHAEGIHVDRQLAARLDRIAMDAHALPMGQLDDGTDGLDHAGLVVGEHDRDQCRTGSRQLPLECRQVQAPLGIDRNPHGIRCGREHGLVLDGRDGNRTARGAQRLIIGLGAAAREHHLGRRGPDHGRDQPARVLEGAPRLAAGSMHGRRIAHTLEDFVHGHDHGRPDRRGRIVVEIAEPVHGFPRHRRGGRMTARGLRKRRPDALRRGWRGLARSGAQAAPRAPSVPPPAGSAGRGPATPDRS